MLPTRERAALLEHLRADKVLRTQTLLASHRLAADSVVAADGSTVMHLVCRAGAENVFWAVRRKATASVFLAKDSRGRTPCHYAAVLLLKTGKMSVFNNIIQPMIDACSGCLHAPDVDGGTPLQILARHSLAAQMLRAQLAQAPDAGARQTDSWQEKVWAEMQYENAKFDKYDGDFSECLSDDAETTETWGDRLGAEHAARHRPEPRPRLPANRREQERQQRRRHEEQERQRRFREAEQRRKLEEEARKKARSEAAKKRLNETPAHASHKMAKVVRRYRALHKLVHGGDGRLVPADFKALAAVTLRDLRRLVETGAENASDRRRAVRDMLRLWHPDKCMAKIEGRLSGDVEQVKTAVVSFVQLLNQLL